MPHCCKFADNIRLTLFDLEILGDEETYIRPAKSQPDPPLLVPISVDSLAQISNITGLPSPRCHLPQLRFDLNWC